MTRAFFFRLKLLRCPCLAALEAMSATSRFKSYIDLRLQRPIRLQPDVVAKAKRMVMEVDQPWAQGFALLAAIEVVSLAIHIASPILDRDPFVAYPSSIQHLHL